MRSRRSWWAGVAAGVAALLTGLAGPLSAQDNPIERARVHMERGQELYTEGRYLMAGSEFEAAYQIKPFAAFLFNAGVAFERAGEPSRAADFFARYLEREPNASDRDAVRQRMERLRTAALGGGAEAVTATTTTTTTTMTEEATPDSTGGGGVGPGGQGGAGGEGTPEEGATELSAAGPGTAAGGVASLEAAPGAAEPQDMKALVSVETDPVGATVSLFRAGTRVARGRAPFATAVDQGEYRVLIDHPSFKSVERGFHVLPGTMYVVLADMRQGDFLGHLTVVSRPAGAEVYLDDRDQGSFGETPWQGRVVATAHKVWVVRPGYEPVEKEIAIEPGSVERIEVELERVQYGRLRVVSNVPGAAVYVGPDRVGEVPFDGKVPAGAQRVRVVAEGMKTWEDRVVVPRGQMVPVRVRLRPEVDRSSAWGTAVISALFLGGGTALLIVGNGLESDLDRDRMDLRLENEDSRLLKAKALTYAGDAALGMSLLFGALATYYFVRDPLEDSDAAILEARDWAFVPLLLPRRAEGRFRWSF